MDAFLMFWEQFCIFLKTKSFINDRGPSEFAILWRITTTGHETIVHFGPRLVYFSPSSMEFLMERKLPQACVKRLATIVCSCRWCRARKRMTVEGYDNRRKNAESIWTPAVGQRIP